MSGNKSLPGADPIRAAFLFGPSRLAFLLCSGQPTASTANGVIFFSIFLSWREGMKRGGGEKDDGILFLKEEGEGSRHAKEWKETESNRVDVAAGSRRGCLDDDAGRACARSGAAHG